MLETGGTGRIVCIWQIFLSNSSLEENRFENQVWVRNARQSCPSARPRHGEAQKAFLGVWGRPGEGKKGAEVSAVSMPNKLLSSVSQATLFPPTGRNASSRSASPGLALLGEFASLGEFELLINRREKNRLKCEKNPRMGICPNSVTPPWHRCMAWNGVVWHGMEWCGMVWHGMEWHGMVWHGVE